MACFTVCFRKKASSPEQTTANLEGANNVKLYSYRELQFATENFSTKIGQGGFGSVYKGKLKDGSIVAIKVLSADSSQGMREFLTEITLISGLEHENLVKLYGCCVEGNHRILVYGYLENNSLAQTLLGTDSSSIRFDWITRTKICIGVAQGLVFLHEGVQPHIVHRDIKASNILLDKDLNPKISDFGLAKLFPDSVTHLSTRVAGTHGYLAPEYALRGHLTRKADVYSFGILLLEIVSRSCHKNNQLPEEDQYLLQRTWSLYEQGELVKLVDTTLEGDFDVGEACKYLKVGLLCTQVIAKRRPSMSTVVKMLTGEMDVDEEKISKPGMASELIHQTNQNNNASYAASGSGKKDIFSSLTNTSMSYADMTFNSIYDRSY